MLHAFGQAVHGHFLCKGSPMEKSRSDGENRGGNRWYFMDNKEGFWYKIEIVLFHISGSGIF